MKLGYESQHKGAVHFTSATIIPKLTELYGTLSNFVACFSRTKVGEEILQEEVTKMLIAVQEKHEMELEDARHLGRMETMEHIQERYQLVGLDIQEGCKQSKQGYQDARSLLSFESREEANLRAQQAGTYNTMCQLSFD